MWTPWEEKDNHVMQKRILWIIISLMISLKVVSLEIIKKAKKGEKKSILIKYNQI